LIYSESKPASPDVNLTSSARPFGFDRDKCIKERGSRLEDAGTDGKLTGMQSGPRPFH
jgi:hypothetical protein